MKKSEELKLFEQKVNNKFDLTDEHIGQLQESFNKMNEKMGQGFSQISESLKTVAPEYDFVKTVKTIGYTLAIGGSLVSGLLWLISSQVAVPLNELDRLRTDFVKLEKVYALDKMDFHKWKVNVTTMKKDLDGNSLFIDNYMFEEKVPVQNAIRDKRLERLEEMSGMMLNKVHKK